MMELTIINHFFSSKHVNRTVFKFGYQVCNSMFELVLFKALPCMITTSSLSDFMYCILSTIFKLLYYLFKILIHKSITTYKYCIHTTVLFIRSIKAILLTVAPKYGINTVAIITLVLTDQTRLRDFSYNQ